MGSNSNMIQTGAIQPELDNRKSTLMELRLTESLHYLVEEQNETVGKTDN